MKIIVLEGDKDKGKTTTISMVYATLVANGAAVHEFAVITNEETTEDFEALLFYQGKRIAICSYGDIQGDYDIKVNAYSVKADVLIIADSTNSSTGSQTPPFVSLPKTLSGSLPTNSEVKANAKDCHKIISLI